MNSAAFTPGDAGRGRAAAASIFQYNAHIPGVDRLYVVAQRYNADPSRPSYDAAPLFLRAAALKLPGVADATSYVPSRPEQRPLAVRINGQLHELRGLVVLPGFDTTLGLEARHGDLRAGLERPENIVITGQAALRLFGRIDTVGRTLQAEGQLLRVGAVLRQPSPKGCSAPWMPRPACRTSRPKRAPCWPGAR